jgi:hypothetical protein
MHAVVLGCGPFINVINHLAKIWARQGRKTGIDSSFVNIAKLGTQQEPRILIVDYLTIERTDNRSETSELGNTVTRTFHSSGSQEDDLLLRREQALHQDVFAEFLDASGMRQQQIRPSRLSIYSCRNQGLGKVGYSSTGRSRMV